jgi:hypothetical protein
MSKSVGTLALPAAHSGHDSFQGLKKYLAENSGASNFRSRGLQTHSMMCRIRHDIIIIIIIIYYFYSCSITSTTGRGLIDTVACQVPILPSTSSGHLALNIHKLAYVWSKYNYS